MAAVELAAQLVYLACVVVAVRLWWQSRSPQAAWSAATFSLLGALVLLGIVRGEEPLPAPFDRVMVVAVLLLPWLLFRFADSVVGASPRLRRGIDALAWVVALSGLVVVLPAPDETPDATQQAWILAIVGAWFAQALVTTALLWRAGRGLPGVTRGRLRMLAAGSLLLGFAVVASAGPGTEETDQLVSQLFSLTASITFLMGYAPPAMLRHAWRAGDERRLYEAAVGLLGAHSEHEVSQVLLPGLRQLLGAPGVRARNAEGKVVAASGDVPDGAAVDPLDCGPWTVEVVRSPAMPLFGAGEADLAERLGLMASLATERVRLHTAERAARQEAEAAGEALAAANDDLASVNAELEAFVYTTSHDLKNPIIAILGYVEVLETDFAEHLPEDAHWYLERMSVNAKFMDSLIRDLLELSRVGRMEVTPSYVRTRELLATITEDATARHPDLDLQVSWPQDLPDLWANATRARQLLENLVENACRYAGRDDVEVTVLSTVDDEGVRIHVRDNGRGIPAEQCERIFGMFERLDPDSSKGTGIGLAICRRIVESLGGEIAALPDPDGAHFRIILPTSALATEDQRPELPVDDEHAPESRIPA